ncbi:putative nucleotide-diphospho-sugar transferase [Pseudoruegeria sp. SK021]|uniref:putative nucleotide-diphospho-sugar transferase n=1 Tax=Pseudoruegeria sp. SK021 TaxID=1933035 RepID=UPI000A25AF63|nr:putative nucleotide-diphospho-sugar transferase [Pseudoruegeria sp. SK021]OSP56105.1 hypothetical protein BV911_03980 [Pseudoruegeria sp. SK021]
MTPWLDPSTLPADSCGFVFNATGRRYQQAAERAARSLRAASPGFPIDFYTDDPSTVADGVFDQVHTLDHVWFRPKFEALIRSRFQRTICMDADIFVLADISDIFVLLDTHDIAASHVDQRNQGYATTFWRKPIPNSFPQVNGGLIGIRKSDEILAFLNACQDALVTYDLPQDQPVIRELLFDSTLRLAVLPFEYNMRDRTMARFSGSKIAAPRVLHRNGFQGRPRKNGQLPTPEDLYGVRTMQHFRQLVRADKQLSKGPYPTIKAPLSRGLFAKLMFFLRR